MRENLSHKALIIEKFSHITISSPAYCLIASIFHTGIPLL